MSVILFILILGALIFVHELGHFLAAKKNGIRVDEFAIGFPPKIFSFQRGETKYSLNMIPFGGFVKIFGETPDEKSLDPNATNSFVNKSKWIQALVLVAGVTFNIIFAWFLFLIILTSGMPAAVTDANQADIVDAKVVIMGIFPESPAEMAGIQAGDIVLEISNQKETITENINIETVKRVINESESKINLKIARKHEEQVIEIYPIAGIVEGNKAIGISMERIGQRKLSFWKAIPESFSLTGENIKGVFVGLGTFFGMIKSGEAELDHVSGPIGIVSLVGNAAQFGWANILSFTALLSINLAVLNIMPFPALDGGRLLFLGIEGVTRRKIKPKIANFVNAAGFLLLIGLMILVTINDIVKMF